MENNEILRALLYKTIYRVKRFITLMICMESSLSLFNTSLIIYCNAILRSFKNRSTKDRNSSGNISTSNRKRQSNISIFAPFFGRKTGREIKDKEHKTIPRYSIYSSLG